MFYLLFLFLYLSFAFYISHCIPYPDMCVQCIKIFFFKIKLCGRNTAVPNNMPIALAKFVYASRGSIFVRNIRWWCVMWTKIFFSIFNQWECDRRWFQIVYLRCFEARYSCPAVCTVQNSVVSDHSDPSRRQIPTTIIISAHHLL